MAMNSANDLELLSLVAKMPRASLEAVVLDMVPRPRPRTLVPSTDWRNGSASDSSPEGYAFESRIGHSPATRRRRADGTPTGCNRSPDQRGRARGRRDRGRGLSRRLRRRAGAAGPARARIRGRRALGPRARHRRAARAPGRRGRRPADEGGHPRLREAALVKSRLHVGRRVLLPAAVLLLLGVIKTIYKNNYAASMSWCLSDRLLPLEHHQTSAKARTV